MLWLYAGPKMCIVQAKLYDIVGFVLSIPYNIAWQACSIDQSLLNLYTLPSLIVNYTRSCHVIFAIYQTSAYHNHSIIYTVAVIVSYYWTLL